MRSVCSAGAVEAAAAPAIERDGVADQLVGDGKPFLVLDGELGNSSASSREYVAERWTMLEAMQLNTVPASVCWELVEPQGGAFDFSGVGWRIEDTRA